MSESAIYEGTVRHRRFAVRPHGLNHRLALAYIDLEELPELLGGLLLAARPGPVRFRRADYLGPESIPLADAVRDVVEARTGARPEGPIRLLAHLRTWGHCFNPVSFYYCMDSSGAAVEAVLAEVTNTPWGERHCYVLSPQGNSPTGVLAGEGFKKGLHVSPFMGMDHRYEWRLTAPGRTLSIHIESHRAGQLAFDATLALERRQLSRASLAAMTARYPLGTLRVLALIYAHGVALKLKGVPLHPHPRTGAA
ncbi:MAG: DUF1365 domain-containing protein [Actinomycetota bacterium]|nr:DUF1365 domain-containing protein [Actinomycetota bacterium]